MTTLQHMTIFLVIVLLSGKTCAQDKATTNFYDQIKNYDLSTILTADSILAEDREDSKDKFKRAEVLGFIGDNYQRFYIHFISIIKNPTNPYEYLAYGKTMVKETVCSFQGKIIIKESRISKSDDVPTYRQGRVICEIILYEDKKQSSTGFINGKMTSDFIIDDKGIFRYDALMFVADGFANNQFIGSWTSYKTNVSKKCNWGDYRIPDSKEFDIGTGEFSVSEKYIKNGWVSYMLENRMMNLNVIEQTGDSKTNVNKEWWK